MEKKLEIGLSFKQDKIVTDTDTAVFWGSGNLDVFATPAMVCFMENTALKCLDGYIDEGFDTVGIGINTTHIKASKIGKEVYCEAIINEIDGKKISFKIKAWDKNGDIGNAKHVRYIVNKTKFLSHLD